MWLVTIHDVNHVIVLKHTKIQLLIQQNEPFYPLLIWLFLILLILIWKLNISNIFSEYWYFPTEYYHFHWKYSKNLNFLRKTAKNRLKFVQLSLINWQNIEISVKNCFFYISGFINIPHSCSLNQTRKFLWV